MADPQLIYWDTNVFLDYINKNPARLPTIEAILDEMTKRDKDKIVTSTLTKVEVAWSAIERLERYLRIDEEERIDDLWNDSSVVEFIEFNDAIALLARDFMRKGMESGGKRLKTNDAIHLASAIWVGALELNTYDLSDFEYFQRFVDIQICVPHTDQLKLF